MAVRYARGSLAQIADPVGSKQARQLPYIGFQMVVLAALRARLKGWVPSGKYTLGAWGLPVNIAALAYGVIAMVNMAWPRTPDAPWYDNWIVALSGLVVITIGLVYMKLHPPARPQHRAVRRRDPKDQVKA